MMDCRQVKSLLPLWVGQDLPDAATASDVAKHLEKCHDCECRRNELQSSLEVLQGLSAETLSIESAKRSIWPGLVSRISEWETLHRRERFNGWIPASVMALAVILMIAVSLPSIRDEFFGDHSGSTNVVDLFGSESSFDLDGQLDANQKSKTIGLPGRPGLGKPVNYRSDQW